MNKFAFLHKFAYQFGIVLIVTVFLSHTIHHSAISAEQDSLPADSSQLSLRERMASRELNRQAVNPSWSQTVNRLSDEERRQLRQHIYDAGRELYPTPLKH